METKRKRFENIYRYLKQSKDFDKLSVKELMWKVYNQACVDCGEESTEISIEETKRIIEDSMFLDFVQECILNPEESQALPQNDYVRVTFPCTDKDKCVAWPDRCSDVGGNGETCSSILNLSKLCGIESNKSEKINDKILTAAEIDALSKALKENEND